MILGYSGINQCWCSCQTTDTTLNLLGNNPRSFQQNVHSFHILSVSNMEKFPSNGWVLCPKTSLGNHSLYFVHESTGQLETQLNHADCLLMRVDAYLKSVEELILWSLQLLPSQPQGQVYIHDRWKTQYIKKEIQLDNCMMILHLSEKGFLLFYFSGFIQAKAYFFGTLGGWSLVVPKDGEECLGAVLVPSGSEARLFSAWVGLLFSP